jgi:hypothetical protein
MVYTVRMVWFGGFFGYSIRTRLSLSCSLKENFFILKFILPLFQKEQLELTNKDNEYLYKLFVQKVILYNDVCSPSMNLSCKSFSEIFQNLNESLRMRFTLCFAISFCYKLVHLGLNTGN